MPAVEGNKYAIGNSGKHKAFETVEEMETAIQAYFTQCDDNMAEVYDKTTGTVRTVKKPIPYTVEGLCLALGCLERQTLLNYQKEKGYEEYFDTIKNAKMKIQHNKLIGGLNGTYNCAVAIFDMKNNCGYKDKQEVEQRTVQVDIDAKDLEGKSSAEVNRTYQDLLGNTGE